MIAAAHETTLRRYSRRAMATTFEIVVPWETSHSETAASDALNFIDQLESQLTVFRPTSEVSRLNRLAEQAPVPVESGLFQLLQLAQQIHDQTGGAFDIAMGPLIKAWGFFRRQGQVPNETKLTKVRQNVGMKHVQLDAARRTVRFDRPGIEINLGSIGKGYAVDRAIGLLKTKYNVDAALIHGGTSSVFASGPMPWTVGIQHPWESRRLGTLHLVNRGMATTGATHQHFAYNGRKLGHVLDPRTGWPAEGTALAVALAPTAAEADALSTAFFVMGLDATRDYCERHAGIAALMLTDEPDAEPIAINCDDGEWMPAAKDDFYLNSDLNDE